jgi:quinol monooxygenase YgiN
MVIVTGHLLVDPAARAAYLDECREVVALARATAGCVHFALSADLLDEGRIDVCEVWESQAAVDAFRGSGPSDGQQQAILGARVDEHDVSATRTLA